MRLSEQKIKVWDLKEFPGWTQERIVSYVVDHANLLLDPGELFEVCLSLHQDFGRTNEIGWVTTEELGDVSNPWPGEFVYDRGLYLLVRREVL